MIKYVLFLIRYQLSSSFHCTVFVLHIPNKTWCTVECTKKKIITKGLRLSSCLSKVDNQVLCTVCYTHIQFMLDSVHLEVSGDN